MKNFGDVIYSYPNFSKEDEFNFSKECKSLYSSPNKAKNIKDIVFDKIQIVADFCESFNEVSKKASLDYRMVLAGGALLDFSLNLEPKDFDLFVIKVPNSKGAISKKNCDKKRYNEERDLGRVFRAFPKRILKKLYIAAERKSEIEKVLASIIIDEFVFTSF